MKILFFMLLFGVHCSFGMEEGMEEIPLEDMQLYNPSALQKQLICAVKNNETNISTIIPQLKQAQITRSKKKSNKPLKIAIQEADEYVQTTKKLLGWKGNTARLQLAAAGLTSIVFGLAKAGYDLFLFSDDDNTDPIGHAFNIFSDVILFGGGCFALKIAAKNNTSKSEYSKALLLKSVLEFLNQSSETKVSSLM